MRDRLLVDVEPVGNEGEGDAGRFGLARGLDEEVEIDAGIGRAARMLPGIHVAARALQHDAERDVFLSHGINPPWKWSGGEGKPLLGEQLDGGEALGSRQAPACRE